MTWSAPSAGSQGGVLTTYTICFLKDNEDTCSVERTYPASSLPLSLVEDSLLPDTVYRVRVCASTAAGDGPCSSDLSFTTGMGWIWVDCICCFFGLRIFMHELVPSSNVFEIRFPTVLSPLGSNTVEIGFFAPINAREKRLKNPIRKKPRI